VCSSSQGCHTATGTHMPHGITQCYLPPGRGDIPALTSAEAGTRLSDPRGMQGWVDLHTHTHARLTALFPGLPRWAGTRKVKPIWILLKREPESGSGISWAICKSSSCSRQTTTPAPHLSVFYRPDALPAAQPTASKHWRHKKHWRHNLMHGLVCH